MSSTPSSPAPASVSASVAAAAVEPLDARKIVRAAERDPWNRLHSIVEDADFVKRTALSYPHVPVVRESSLGPRLCGEIWLISCSLAAAANLRCGAWYVPNASKGEGCYFKSTDGHTHQWSFSLKRPNLALVELCIERGGAILVDSTRRGKVGWQL